MARVFNPPPGWPKPEEGWTPPPGWKPDPSWPEPPKGWDFWTEKVEEFGSSLFSSTAASASSLFGDANSGADSYGTVSTPQEGEQGGTEYGAPHAPTYTSPSGSTTSESEAHSGGGASSAPPAYGGSSGAGAQAGPNQAPSYGGASGSGAQSSPNQPPSYGGASGSGVQPGPTQPSSYGGASGSGVQPGPTSAPSTQGGPTAPPGAPTAPADATPKRAGGTIGGGVVLFLIGLGVTAYSYMNPNADGEYRLWWAPMLFGVILIIQGLVQLVKNRKANTTPRYTGAGYGGQPGSTETGLGHNSTVPTQNPTDPSNYKRGR